MLPAGLWYKGGKRRVNEKFRLWPRSHVPDGGRRRLRKKRPQSAPAGRSAEDPVRHRQSFPQDLKEFTGASSQTVKTLCSAGYRASGGAGIQTAGAGNGRGACSAAGTQSRSGQGLPRYPQTQRDRAAAALLFGVTGSGKTTVYIRLIAELRRRGRTALLLVPEIALTPQMLRTFLLALRDDIAVLHSSLSAGERLDEWRRIKRARPESSSTRSAVFAPRKSWAPSS